MHVGNANLHVQYEMNNQCLATTKERKDLDVMILIMNNLCLATTNEEKDLGVMITNSLKFDMDCQDVKLHPHCHCHW